MTDTKRTVSLPHMEGMPHPDNDTRRCPTNDRGRQCVLVQHTDDDAHCYVGGKGWEWGDLPVRLRESTVGELKGENRRLRELLQRKEGAQAVVEAARKLKIADDNIAGVEHEICSEPPCTGCLHDDAHDELNETLQRYDEESGRGETLMKGGAMKMIDRNKYLQALGLWMLAKQKQIQCVALETEMNAVLEDENGSHASDAIYDGNDVISEEAFAAVLAKMEIKIEGEIGRLEAENAKLQHQLELLTSDQGHTDNER